MGYSLTIQYEDGGLDMGSGQPGWRWCSQRSGSTFWQTAEAGQKNAKGQQCARLKERQIKLGSQRDAKVTGNSPERNVFGWISPAKFSYNARPPVPPMLFDPLLIGA